MAELSADYRLALAKEALDRLTEDYGYPVTGDPQHWPEKDAAFILEQLEAAAGAKPAPVLLTDQERIAVIRRAVKIIEPNVPNETAAWNIWNNLAGDREFRDAIVMIADYLQFGAADSDQNEDASVPDTAILEAEEAAERPTLHTQLLEDAQRLGIPHYHVPGNKDKGLRN